MAISTVYAKLPVSVMRLITCMAGLKRDLSGRRVCFAAKPRTANGVPEGESQAKEAIPSVASVIFLERYQPFYIELAFKARKILGRPILNSGHLQPGIDIV